MQRESKLNIKKESSCFICGFSVDSSCLKLFSFVSKYSKTSVQNLLQQVIAQSPYKSDINDLESNLCQNCSDQLNQYDYGIWMAKRAQEVLQKCFIEKHLKPSNQQPSNICIDIPIKVSKEEAQPMVFDDDNQFEDLPAAESDDDESVYSDDSQTPEVIEISIVTSDESGDDIKEEEDNEGGVHKVKQTYTIQGPRKATKIPQEKRKYQRRKETDLDCRLCGLRFTTDEEFKEHSAKHEGIDPLQCPICHKHFHKKGGLVVHMSIHTGEKKYVCSLCGKAYIHYASFHIHTLAHNNIREKKCEICGKLFYSNSHLNRHMRVHSGVKPFRCHCGREFAQRYNLTVHQKAHEGIQVVRKKKVTTVEPL